MSNLTNPRTIQEQTQKSLFMATSKTHQAESTPTQPSPFILHQLKPTKYENQQQNDQSLKKSRPTNNQKLA